MEKVKLGAVLEETIAKFSRNREQGKGGPPLNAFFISYLPAL
ncbi:MAG: hypothetical protein ACREQ7_25530 [Candidatus Binatia bacterium]